MNKERECPQWVAPEKGDVARYVEFLGGVTAVGRLVRKDKSTVSGWCSGKFGKIDYANWVLLSRLYRTAVNRAVKNGGL